MNSASLHCRGKRSPAYRLHRDRSVPSAHPNAGCRRNPGRNDGLTWNGASFVCVDQIGDYSDSDPFSDVCPVCEEEYQKEASTRRPRTIEISLAEIPMKVSKPKTRMWFSDCRCSARGVLTGVFSYRQGSWSRRPSICPSNILCSAIRKGTCPARFRDPI